MRTTMVVAALVLAVAIAHADVARFDPPDPRLEKKVTVEVAHAKLEDVAKSLTKQTGVTIKAGTGTRDWKVREQHITVHAKDIPLGKVLDHITKVHSFYLSREGKQDEWSYIIWQDKKGRELEAEMLNAENEVKAEQARKKCQAGLDAARKAAKMTPDEARRLQDKDPTLAYLGGTKSGRAFAQIMSWINSTDLDLMLRGKRVAIPFGSLPPAIQQAALNSRNTDSKDPNLTPLQLVVVPVPDDEQQISAMGIGGGIVLMGMPPGGTAEVGYNHGVGPGVMMSVFPLADPESRLGKAFAKGMLAVEDTGSFDEFEKAMDAEFSDPSAIFESMANESPTEKEPPTDPALTREVELSEVPQSSPFAPDTSLAGYDKSAVKAISQALGDPVLLESFPGTRTPVAMYLKNGKQPVYQMMVGIEKAGYTWKIEDSVLRIRPKDWATKRSYAIPESTLKRYVDLLESQGMFALGDIAALTAELTDAQIDRTLMRNEDIYFALSCLRQKESRGLLRLYASLTSRQKDYVHSEKGLQFADLSDSQWALVAETISDRVGGLYVTGGTIRNTHSEDFGRTHGGFFEVISETEDQQQHSFSVSLHVTSKGELADRIAARKAAREQAAKKDQDQPAEK